MTESSRASLPELTSESELTFSPVRLTKKPRMIFVIMAAMTITIAAVE